MLCKVAQALSQQATTEICQKDEQAQRHGRVDVVCECCQPTLVEHQYLPQHDGTRPAGGKYEERTAPQTGKMTHQDVPCKVRRKAQSLEVVYIRNADAEALDTLLASTMQNSISISTNDSTTDGAARLSARNAAQQTRALANQSVHQSLEI